MRKNNIKIALLSPIDLTFFKKYIKEKIPKKFIDLGSGPSINSLSEELINKGHKLLIVSISSKIKKEKIFNGKRIKIYIVPKNNNILEKIITKLFFYNFFEIFRIIEILKKEKPNIINSHFWCELSIAAKLSGFPYLITGHDRATKVSEYYNFISNPLNKFRWFCKFYPLKFILNKTNSVSVVSNTIKDYLVSNNLFNKKIYTIPNSINVSKFKKKKVNSRFNIIVIMNGLIEFKNPKLCMQTFKLVNKDIPYAKLYMFGKDFGKNEKGFIWAKKNKLDKDIVFKGQISHDMFKKFLISRGDLLINLSLEETHSFSSIDAFSSKVPVLIYKKCEGTFDTIHKGKFGFFINSLDPFKITNLIKKLQANRGLIAKKANDAYHYALMNLDKKKIVMQYLNLYDKKIKEFKHFKK
jgi:glycosyltransferase involved in cell wall biosynthesis